jgi:hypothetical protein
LKEGIIKVGSIILTIIVLAVSATLWASSEHSSIQENAREKYLLKENADDKFAPKGAVITVEGKVERVEKDIDEINMKLDKVDGKMDNMLRMMSDIHYRSGDER